MYTETFHLWSLSVEEAANAAELELLLLGDGDTGSAQKEDNGYSLRDLVEQAKVCPCLPACCTDLQRLLF